jgi:hypothetical protein
MLLSGSPGDIDELIGAALAQLRGVLRARIARVELAP